MSAHLLPEFSAVESALRVMGEALRQRLTRLLEDARVPVHSVTMRVKHPQSLARKLARPDKSYSHLWDITDLVALRVETYFEDHLEAVSRLVEHHFRVDLANSIARERPAGYRSIHYVCWPGDQLGPPHAQCRFELQLRTVLQHAWAEVEHDLGYKTDDAVPEEIRRRFARVAGLLEIADQEFVSIRRELAASRERARARLQSREDLPIDLVSLEALSQEPTLRALDELVSKSLARPQRDELFFPDYLVRFLRLSGLETTSQVARAVDRFTPHFADGLTRYAHVARAALNFDLSSVAEIHRGYALLPLAHLALVRGDGLGLNKVARLTRVYQALEFPDDEAAAHRIATSLVDALSESELHFSLHPGVRPP